jgi:hypothetical protein
MNYRHVLKDVPFMSRHDDPAEERNMREWIWALAPWERALVKSVWCDSNSQHDYHVIFRLTPTMQRGPDYVDMGRRLKVICIRNSGGFNGIWLEHKDEVFFDYMPEWSGPLMGNAA